MAKYELITINDKEKLKEFYDDSSFTFEGFSLKPESLDQLASILEREGLIKDEITIYTYLGDLMNKNYGLYGDHAYPKDLNLVTITLDNFKPEKIGYLAMFRLNSGARWFDDIVDNNDARMGIQKEIEEDNDSY